MTAARLPTQQLTRLTGHTGPINTLTYSSGSGQYLLSGSSDRSINLYNPAKDDPTKALIQRYTGAHSHSILGIAVNSSNSQFLSCGGDKFICVWDVASARTLRKLGGGGPGSHRARVECVSWAGEGEAVVVSGSYDATVRLWDMRSQAGRPMMVLAEARDSVDCLSVEGAEIWAGSVDGRVRGYDVRMGVLNTDVFGQPVTSITPTLDSSSHLISTLDSTLRLMDKPTGRLLKSYTSPSSSETSSNTPSTFADTTAGSTTSSTVYQNTTYRIQSTLVCADALALAGSEDGSIWAWDVLTGELVHRLWHVAGAGVAKSSDYAADRGNARKVVSAVAWRRKGGRGGGEWASAGADGTIVVWGYENKS